MNLRVRGLQLAGRAGSPRRIPAALVVALGLLCGALGPGLAAATQERQVVKEKLEVPSNKDLPARLRYGMLMVPGSERITDKKGKTAFERVEGEPEKGQYAITPAGVLTFNKKNRGDQLLASYIYRPRTVAVLPIQMDAGPKELRQRTRRDTCELFQAYGFEVVPETKVDKIAQEQRIYASTELEPEELMKLGKDLGADDLVLLQTVEWNQASGRGLVSMIIQRNPFGGPRKNVRVVLNSRVYDAGNGRLVWESRQSSERKGSTMFGVSEDLKRLAVNKAIVDLFYSYFQP